MSGILVNGDDGEAAIAEMCEHAPPLETEANARLIAAAPDLLAALKAALRHWHADGRNFYKTEPAWLAQARAAIAKATGDE